MFFGNPASPIWRRSHYSKKLWRLATGNACVIHIISTNSCPILAVQPGWVPVGCRQRGRNPWQQNGLNEWHYADIDTM